MMQIENIMILYINVYLVVIAIQSSTVYCVRRSINNLKHTLLNN